MFGWLRRLWKKRNRRQRFIFRFWDGERDRAVDPAVAWRALHEDPELVMPDDLTGADQGDIEATRKVVDAVRRAFDVKGWTEAEAGLTEMECLELLQSYWDYTESLKKNTEPPPTLPSPTESECWGPSMEKSDSA